MEEKGSDRPRVVAVVSTDSGVGRDVLRGIAIEAERFGWAFEVIDLSIMGLDLSPYAPLLRAADGVVVRLDAPYRSLRAFVWKNVPVVGIDIAPNPDSGLWATLNPDNARIGAMAAEELLSTGRKSFAVVTTLPERPWGAARDKGFIDRIRAGGGEVRHYRLRAFWRGTAEREALMRWLAALPRPFGLFACNDVVARQAIGACKAAGLSVPDDAAVIGADDDESICLYAAPPLSSVRIDHEGGGRRAAEALQRFLGKPHPASTVSLRFGPYGVARRASTGSAAPVGDLRLAAGLDFIARHSGSPLVGAADVAAAMGLGRRQAERLFRAAGKTIRGQMEEARLARAKTLLATTDLPLRRVAADSGVSTDVYLSDLFRKRFGMSPGAWRRWAKAESGPVR